MKLIDLKRRMALVAALTALAHGISAEDQEPPSAITSSSMRSLR